MNTKGEKTKQRILEVAAELFWKNSFQGVNTNAICEGASVNKATLYRYFPSKEDLAIAAIEDYCDRTVANVFEASFQISQDPFDRLQSIFQRIYQSHLTSFDREGCIPGCPFVNLGVEMATANPAIRTAIARCFQRFSPYYHQIVQDAKALGRCSTKLNDEQAVAMLMNLMNGVMVTAKINNSPAEIMNMVTVVQLVLQP